MWRIIQFFSKYGNLILFISLELTAFLLVVNLNQKQKRLFDGFVLEISGSIHETNTAVLNYFNLKNENKKLQAENIRLKNELLTTRDELYNYKFQVPLQTRFSLLPDSAFPVEKFDFIPCRSINSTYSKNYNYITLDKGENHGVEKGMGLISPEGIAGMVVSTSPNFSIALSALNKKFRMSARLLGNRNIGTLSWSGGEPEYGILEYIPQTSPLQEGDTVVTSGYSTIFPENFMAGIVHSFDKDNHDGFYNIKVRFFTDFRSMDALYLVKNRNKAELDSLTTAFNAE